MYRTGLTSDRSHLMFTLSHSLLTYLSNAQEVYAGPFDLRQGCPKETITGIYPYTAPAIELLGPQYVIDIVSPYMSKISLLFGSLCP